MDTVHKDLLTISRITPNIYLSGIYPLEVYPDAIKNLKIKYILACVSRKNIADIHDKITMANPDITILYLPYSDVNEQNLWQINNDIINIVKYTKTNDEYEILKQQYNLYRDERLIEIGYHFMNAAISENQPILVHCMAGVSRSVSLVIYYLMKKYFINFDKAYNIVLKHREIAYPNESFREQLKNYAIRRDLYSTKNAEDIIVSVLKSKGIKYSPKY